MSVNIDNFDKICRTCLAEKVNMRPIFEALVADMVMACANVQVAKRDGLPGSICIQCLQQVNRSYSFKQQCEKSDSMLRECLMQSHHLLLQDKMISKSEAPNHAGDKFVEYCLKTEQLKLEISDHLNLDVKQATTLKSQPVNKNCTKTPLDPESNFQCNECHENFKA